MTEQELKELREILQAAEERHGRLEPHEVAFVNQVRERVKNWGRKTKVSEKQWAWLRAIGEKVFAVG